VCWLGHVIWIDHQHVPQQAVYCEVSGFRSRPGCPRTNWRGSVKKDSTINVRDAIGPVAK